MMGPYQVYGVRHLAACIHEDSGNGYIWHSASARRIVDRGMAPMSDDSHDQRDTRGRH